MSTHIQSLFGKRLSEGRFLGSEDPFLSFPGTAYYHGSPHPNISFSIGREDMFKHILLLGGTGSGKSNVIHQMVKGTLENESPNSINVIFDTKGDYYSHPGFFRRNDYIIGNGKQFRDISDIWNIFDEIMIDGNSDEDIEANAREISSILFKGRGSQSQPFFANAARDLFATTLIYFFRRSQQRPSVWLPLLNNQSLFEFIMRTKPEQYREYYSHYNDFRGVLTYIGDGKSNQALGVRAELNSMLYDCFQGVFRKKANLNQRNISVRRIIREKKKHTLFIEYDLSLGETLSPIYSLLIDLALKEALSGENNGNTYLFLDELKLLPKVSHLEDALNFGRGKGVSVTAGLQSINQMTEVYGSERGQVILGGFGSLIAMKTTDSASHEYISNLFGTNLTAYRYENDSHYPIDREREGYTVEKWDQAQLIVGQGIIGLSSQNEPFLFRFEHDPAVK